MPGSSGRRGRNPPWIPSCDYRGKGDVVTIEGISSGQAQQHRNRCKEALASCPHLRRGYHASCSMLTYQLCEVSWALWAAGRCGRA
jgi:hypothetical protein